MLAGLVADGNAYVSSPQLETFFTPSHGVLYSGFIAATAWIAWQIAAGLRRGWSLATAIPRGYGLGLLGAAIFAAGGAFDLAWHTAFGIEADLAALLSRRTWCCWWVGRSS